MVAHTSITQEELDYHEYQKEQGNKYKFNVFKRTAMIPRRMSNGEWVMIGKEYYYTMNCNSVYMHFAMHPKSTTAPYFKHVYRWSKAEYMLACIRGEIINGNVEREWYQSNTGIIDIMSL